MEIFVARGLRMICLLLIVGIQALAQPKIEWPQGTEHDFGTIYKGQTVTHHFVIKNGGTDTLLITGVGAQCGCTAALVSSMRIPPDSTSEFKVSFSSWAFGGPVQKSVNVTSNDPKAPNSMIFIRSNVVPVLQFDPGSLTFNVRGDSLTLYHSSLKVKNMSGKPLRILSVDSRYDGLEVKLNRKFLKAGDSTEVQLSLKARGDFVGFRGGTIIFKTDFQAQPDHSFNVMVGAQK